ncbi:hypothetical protein MMC29_008256 [Sticta canariensis]|nr:hypothetical protein [Sticta canariensis]
MKRLNGQDVDYRYKVLEVNVDEEKANDPDAYAVTVVTERDGKEQTFDAKYVLGFDDAHSAVQRSLGFKMIGDTSDSIWGVMDIFPRTNFPDIRKTGDIAIQGGQFDPDTSRNRLYEPILHRASPRNSGKQVKSEDLQAAARQISDPIRRYNIGWKLVSILKGQTGPELLKTYIIEWQRIAEILIDWDKVWAKQMVSMGKDAGGVLDADGNIYFSEIFVKAEAFTAGLTVSYDDSSITRAKASSQQLETNLIIGMRFPSVQVI